MAHAVAGKPAYLAWREAAKVDANPWLSGWSCFSEAVETAGDDPWQLVDIGLQRLNVPVPLVEEFVHRQLNTVSGWSSHVQYRVRECAMRGARNDALVDLLAIRLVYDLALFLQYASQPELMAKWTEALKAMQQYDPQIQLLPRYLAQLALEQNYRDRTCRKIFAAKKTISASSARKKLQAVFCIDVRSEVFRRALESQSSEIQTFGFAGFFGLPIEFVPFGERKGTAQCPVLLSPAYRVTQKINGGQEGINRFLGQIRVRKRVNHAWNSFKTSAISCFSFVETAGLMYGPLLVKDSLGLGLNRKHASQLSCQLDLSGETPATHHFATKPILLNDQVDLAAAFLRNLGLTGDFASLILICGHGSETRNNPYASSFDCGACGGHSGEVNARVAAAILNNAEVRRGLSEKGFHIPENTHFLGGLHNTTTDEVQLFDRQAVPPAQRDNVEEVERWLAAAGQVAREERSKQLPLPVEKFDAMTEVLRRSRDWSEVRPEWGLAGNASFIVAPRSCTSGVNLEGRSFLHDYDPARDESYSVLESIITAPMVVTNWINLQYYASTVNNSLYGSGNKTIHNVVGTLGIWQGNGGDLQTGLPMQSLCDGERWIHEPLRLSALIQAPDYVIKKILAAHPEVRRLVENEWIHVYALDEATNSCVSC